MGDWVWINASCDPSASEETEQNSMLLCKSNGQQCLSRKWSETTPKLIRKKRFEITSGTETSLTGGPTSADVTTLNLYSAQFYGRRLRNVLRVDKLEYERLPACRFYSLISASWPVTLDALDVLYKGPHSLDTIRSRLALWQHWNRCF